MRIRHSLKAFIPVILMLAGARTVQAQGGPPMQGMPGPGMPMAGQQIPGSYGMYPNQSPYQGMFEQTYQRDGTWFQNSVNGFGPTNRPRDWFMNLDYTKAYNRKMSGLVGASNVQTYLQQYPQDGGATGGGATGGTTGSAFSYFKYFDAASASLIPDLKTNGIRLTGGFWNPDGSGFLYSGGYQFENTEVFDARARQSANRLDTATALRFQRDGGQIGYQPFNSGGTSDSDILRNQILAPGVVFDTTNTVDYGPYGTTFDVLDRSVHNLYGLPTTNGSFVSTVPASLNGQTAPYDLEFILRQKISTGGANANWAFSPVYDNDRIKVRPIFGGRYFRIDETFSFYGESTLLSYTTGGGTGTTGGTTTTGAENAKVFSPDTGFLEIPPGSGGGTGGTAGTSSSTYTAPLDATSLIVNSYINSQVVSSLSGPELGFHYELGQAKGIQVTGSTRVAAMFNYEKLQLRGDNIGNFMGVALPTADATTGATVETTMYNTDTTQGPTLNAFSDTASNTHMSPLFEQTLNAQIPIFDRVPVLRDISLLEDAKLSVGWTFLLIGQIAEPNSSIVYDSSPVTGDFLHYQIDRNTFTQNTINLGINWNY